MLNTEVWESEGSIGNHLIIRVKSGALKNVGRKHFSEAKLIKNGGGTRDFLWGGGGRRKEWWVVKEERKWQGFGSAKGQHLVWETETDHRWRELKEKGALH